MSGFDDLTREQMIEIILLQQQEIEVLKAEVEMLRAKLSGGGNGSSAAPFIKPNRQQRREAERAERKKRKSSFVRKRDVPTEEVRHVVETCPDCGRKLSGGWEHARRQVIEISEWAKPTVCEILRKIRGSPDANADETGWREDGMNGYLWSVSTGAERFYYFHRRRAGRIIRHILGPKFEGVLGCDFYAGYDWYMGPKQRCWVQPHRQGGGDASERESVGRQCTASSNNAAERAIRPAVISRKISGGTRSARGSQTKTRLMSVFATWALQGREPIAACAQMIVAANTSTAVAT